jgi:large subunit ribosomal protein L23
MNYNGKPKRSGRSTVVGRRADWKKAVVTLTEGSIDLF